MNRIDNIIVVHSHMNISETEVSSIGKSRVRGALDLYNDLSKTENCKLLFTGGKGGHVGCNKHSHAFYMAKYAVSIGMPVSAIVRKFAFSRHTGEDAILSKPILAKIESDTGHQPRVYIVTSDFHKARAALTWRVHDNNKHNILSRGVPLSYEEAHHAMQAILSPEELKKANNLTMEEMQNLLHESEAKKIPKYFPKENWVALLTQNEMASLGNHTRGWTKS